MNILWILLIIPALVFSGPEGPNGEKLIEEEWTINPDGDAYDPQENNYDPNCIVCRQLPLPSYVPSLYTFFKMANDFAKTNWDEGRIEMDDFIEGVSPGLSVAKRLLCQPFIKYVELPKREPSTAERVLMGVAEKSIGDSVGETVAGNPTFFIGYKYSAPNTSTVDNISNFLAVDNFALNSAMQLQLLNSNTEFTIKSARTERVSQEFGLLMHIRSEMVQGGASVTEMMFEFITFTKAEDSDMLTGTHILSDKTYRLYCANNPPR